MNNVIVFHTVVVVLSLIVGFVVIFASYKWASRRDKSYQQQEEAFRQLTRLMQVRESVDAGWVSEEDYMDEIRLYLKMYEDEDMLSMLSDEEEE